MSSEEQRGHDAALEAIKKDGNTTKAAKHHFKVSQGDLNVDAFTRGWQRACRNFSPATQPTITQPC